MKGLIHQLNVGNGGVPKLPIEQTRVYKERLEKDDWDWSMYKTHANGKPGGHGGPERAVCLYSLECLEKLKNLQFEVFPGALGENFTTQGIDYHLVRVGDVFQVGSETIIRITRVRTPCGTIGKKYSPQAKKGEGIERVMYDAEVKSGNVHSEKWGMSGFYAEVLQEGLVHQGDSIERIQKPSWVD